MQKIIATAALAASLVLPSMCFAGVNSNALSKAEKSGDTFVNVLQSKATYTELEPLMTGTMQKQIKASSIPGLLKQVAGNFGTMKDIKFYSFERFDKNDKMTYIASFSKEKLAALIILTDKTGKMSDFALSPLKQNTAKKSK